QLGHVEGFVDLALVRRAVAEIGYADRLIAAVAVRKRETCADWDLGANDPVPPEEALLAAEHVHRAALALRIAAAPPGQLGHHALGIHTACEHVAVIAVCVD